MTLRDLLYTIRNYTMIEVKVELVHDKERIFSVETIEQTVALIRDYGDFKVSSFYIDLYDEGEDYTQFYPTLYVNI